MPPINGTPASEPLDGTANADEINFGQGGSDTVKALGGDDTLFGGAKFDASDLVDGGTGYDLLDLNGDYSAGVTLGSHTLRNVEEIRFNAGNNYSITTHDGMVKAGQVFKIDGYYMSAGKTLFFDGSAETTGSFLFYDGSLSNDTFIGGSNSDYMIFGGGNDTAIGGDGGDVINIGDLNANDYVDGGAGSDVLYLRGNYSNQLALNGNFIKGIETIGVDSDFTYNLLAQNSLVGAGNNLYVTAEGITGSGKLYFNGSAETDGTFTIRDSIGHDFLTGGQLGDRFEVYHGGTDLVSGQGGDDVFFVGAALDANDAFSGGSGKDWISLDGDYSAGLTMKALTMSGIEDISFGGGFDYKIKLHDGNVAAGETLKVVGGYMNSGDKLDIDGSSETNGRFDFYGGASDDTFKGGAKDDYFTGYQGGTDTFHGGKGDDFADFGSKFSAGDFFDGGEGDDGVYISGNHPAGLTLGSSQFANVESLDLGGDFDYDVTTEDSLVAAGKSFSVAAYWIEPGRRLDFDGSAETDGSFELTGSRGNDILRGGAQADTFFLNREGNDSFSGNGGDDTFYVDQNFTSADRINGGSGFDTIRLGGDFAAPLVLSNNTIKNVEKIDLFWGHDHNLTLADGNLGAGKELKIDGSYLGAGDTAVFDGSAETDGRFHVVTGDAADTIKTGAGDDIIDAGADADTMAGGDGDDTYFVDNAGDEVIEAAGQGIDTVNSSVTFTLKGQHADNLNLTGDAAINGTGNSLDNVMRGNGSANVLRGSSGNDTLEGRGGADTLDGGADTDTASYANAGEGVLADLQTPGVNSGDAAGDIYNSIENLMGSDFADNLRGDGNANTVLGGLGGDTLHGRNGNDVLNGGAGNDTLKGGADADIFVFDQALTAANVDAIIDFNVRDDGLHIDNAVFEGLSTGALHSFAFRANTTGVAGDATDRIIYETDTGKLYFDRDGTGSTYDAVHFATITNYASASLTAADFVVI